MVLLHAIYPTDGSFPPLPIRRDGPLISTEHLTVDGRLWPLLVVKFGPEAQASDLETYLELREEWLRRGEPHVSVLDVREVRLCQVCPSIRQRYVEWLRANAAPLRETLIGSAYLLRSPEGRVMTGLMRHCAGMSSPYVVASTLPQAATWAADRFQDAGLAACATRVRAAFSIPTS